MDKSILISIEREYENSLSDFPKDVLHQLSEIAVAVGDVAKAAHEYKHFTSGDQYALRDNLMDALTKSCAVHLKMMDSMIEPGGCRR